MLRTVMVGCGAMSDGWLRAISETPELEAGIDLVGFVDLDTDRARDRAEAAGKPDAIIGTDPADVIARSGAEAVFDLVVPVARKGVVEAALDAGCHILTEKPMANTMDEARALLAASRKAGKVHAVIQNRRYLPGIRRARALVDSGTLGDLTAVHCDFFIAPHFGGFRDEMEHVLLLDMAIHTFDAARFVASKDPVGVYCQETNPKGSWYAHGAAANALFDCADGTVMTYRGNWAAEGCATTWQSSWRLVGTRGSLLWDGDEGFKCEIVAGDDGFFRPLQEVPVPAAPPLGAQGHAGVILDFLDAIKTGSTPLTTASDNIRSLAMVFGAIESAETGARAAIDIQE